MAVIREHTLLRPAPFYSSVKLALLTSKRSEVKGTETEGQCLRKVQISLQAKPNACPFSQLEATL